MIKLKKFKPYLVAILTGLAFAVVSLIIFVFFYSKNTLNLASTIRVWTTIDISGYSETLRTKIKLPRAYIVQSGSMEPAIKTGSIVISSPAPIYSPGEVVTYRQTPGSKTLITHRIEARFFPEGLDKDPVYLTSGDANEDFDTNKVTQDQVVGKVVVILPYFGYLANFAKQPFGFILLVIVPATIVIYEELKTVFQEMGKSLKKFLLKIRERRSSKKFNELQNDVQRKTSSASMFVKVATIIPILGATFVFIGLASSFFADKETSQNNVLQAAAIFPGQAGSVVINE
ncbi:signal peptidase I, partial [Candidatus Woesebacteria bacterium RIFCSPHIGHO2_12_FULL_40_20]